METFVRFIKDVSIWLVVFRLIVYDGLCVIPTQPISWFIGNVSKLFKLNFKGWLYIKLSYFFDADFTPFLLLFILFLCLINLFAKNQKNKRKFLSKWQVYVLLLSPAVFLQKYIILHNHQLSVLERLDKVYPEVEKHHLIYHEDDVEDSNSIVSLLSVFSARGHFLEDILHLEHNQLYSHAKSILNHMAARPFISHSKSVTTKKFTPLPSSACTTDFYRYLGSDSTSDFRVLLDKGELHAEVYFPTRVNPKFKKSPLVIFVHGGGWRGGDKRFFESNYLSGGLQRFLLDNGLTVAAISYRLLCAGITGQDMVDDVYDSIQYFVKNAERFNIDAENIFLLGTSAGAHLSMLTAVTRDMANVKGVMFLYGPTECRRNMLSKDPWFTERMTNFFFLNFYYDKLCDKVENKTKCAEDMSVVAQVKNCENKYCPPTLLIHGQNDPLVPISQAHLLYDELKRFNVKTALIDIPCSSHDCDVICSSHCSQATLFGIERFLNSVL